MIAVHSVYLKGGGRLSTMKDVARVAGVSIVNVGTVEHGVELAEIFLRVAGVSIATVSRVLAGTAAVTDSTQKKVLAAMEELQYRTAAPVRPVIRKESQLTAVCMENLTSPYYIDLLRGVEDVLSISNCSPLLFNLDNDDRAFAELTQALLSFRVASVLFIGCGDILSRADLEQFPELPAVILAENTPSVPMPFPVVACDAAASGALAAETLPTAGGTVLYIPSVGCTAPEEDPVFQEFERAVAAQNGMTVRLSAEIRQLREQLPGLLRGTECPRAAFVQDNETAVELLHLLRREELRVPDYIITDVLEANHIPYKETRSLEESMPELDILYMTRVQKERFFNEEDYVRLKNSYILTKEKMALAKPDMAVLHPLPRVNEIAYDVDDNPKAYYFQQAQNGLYAREAILCDVLGITLDEVKA